MKKIILHATDYSDNAVAALKYAFTMSLQLDANLLVIHVFDIPTIMGTELKEPYYHLEDDTFKMHYAKLEAFCKQHLGDQFDAMDVGVEAIENTSVVNGIISKAEELDAYLLITGMKGGSWIREIIMGNTTKQLIEKSTCPVLAIPEDISHRQIEKIVYATDFEDEDINAIKKLIEIAKPFDAIINVVHISTKKEYAGDVKMKWFKEQLQNKINYKKIKFEVIHSDHIFNSLSLCLVDYGADLLAMLEREDKGIIKKWFHKDLVKKVEAYGRTPLISFNKKSYELISF